MDDLAAFFSARLDEDEVIAEAAQEVASSDTELAQQAGPCVSGPTYAHIELHGPARVLREVEADRYVLAKYRAFRQELEAQREAEGHVGPTILATFRTLGEVIQVRAAVWRDHPDYRPGWKP